MVGLNSLLSVMHESSKRVSETLQEIYNSEWDGHEELKTIVGVRVAWVLRLVGTYSCLHLNLSLASLSKKIGKQRSQFTLCICIASVTGW